MILAVYHPQQFMYAGSMSGFLNPSEGWWPFLINLAMGDAGGYNADDMWGPAETEPRLEAQRPDGADPGTGREQHPHLGLLRQRQAQRTRRRRTFPPQFLEGLAIRTNSPSGTTTSRPVVTTRVFNFPPNGTHDWGYWGAQLQQMKPDLISYLG